MDGTFTNTAVSKVHPMASFLVWYDKSDCHCAGGSLVFRLLNILVMTPGWICYILLISSCTHQIYLYLYHQYLQQHGIQTIQQFQILKKDISIRLSHPKEVKMVPQPPWSPVHTSQSKTLNHQTITKHKVSNKPQYNRHAYNQSRHRSWVAQKDRERW